MSAFRYWRLLINLTNENGQWVQIHEMEWRLVAGGAKSAPANITTDVADGAAVGTLVNDGDFATGWSTWTLGSLPHSITFDFTTAKTFAELAIGGRPSFPERGPKAFKVQGSTDGVNWVDRLDMSTNATVLAYPDNAFLTFTLPTAPTPQLHVTEGDVLAAINYPSPYLRASSAAGMIAVKFGMDLRASWAGGMIAVKFGMDLHVSNAALLVAVRGRTRNPKIRAWTFTLDGHDFYVLQLGTVATLVYDVYSEQWMDWDAFGESYWPVNIGFNWVDGQGLSGDIAGSNVIVGDDTYPLIYFLNPEQPFDESPEELDAVQEIYFPRTIQGQVPMVGRQVLPCYSTWLTTDMGAPAYDGASVTLEISDDAGKTYDDMGAITVTAGDNRPELAWYSLGQIEAPGRLFRITDDGAIARIDTMEMNDPDDK